MFAADGAFFTVGNTLCPSGRNSLVVVDPLLVRVSAATIEDTVLSTSLFIIELCATLIANIGVVVYRISHGLMVDIFIAIFPVVAAKVAINRDSGTAAALLSDSALVGAVALRTADYSAIVVLMSRLAATAARATVAGRGFAVRLRAATAGGRLSVARTTGTTTRRRFAAGSRVSAVAGVTVRLAGTAIFVTARLRGIYRRTIARIIAV